MWTTRPELRGTHGMVSSTHWLGTAAGMAVLENGGNAFDAAVAAGFVLQVVEPHLCGPGGEVPAIFATEGDPRPRVLCAQGVAPQAASIEHMRGLGYDIMPGSGLLPATVPGAWDGWLRLLRDYGTKTLREVLGYAIGYARHGYPVVERITSTITAVSELFANHWPSSAALWCPHGTPASGMHRNPVLADTWERLLAEAELHSGREAQLDAARSAWYTGFVAEAIDRFCRTPYRDESGAAHPGVLTGEDMARWSASIEDPVTVHLGEWTLAKCGLWSQGTVLAQTLALLEGFRDELAYTEGIPSARTVQLATECAKLAFADREAHFGDSARVSAEELLDPGYLAARRALVTDTANAELRPGSPGGAEPRLPEFVREGRGLAVPEQLDALGAVGEPTVGRTGNTRGDTVHVDVVDARGNIVSATPSGGWLQSSPAIESLGFCLGTRAQMFWLEPGLPNSLAPGKRPRTTLTPSLALRAGEPRLAFGTPGGDQQEQWQLCFWLAHIHGGLDLQSAIDAPAWHSLSFPSSFSPRTWDPGALVVESRLGPDTLARLREIGHKVHDSGPWSLGRMCAVARDPETGLLRAGANPRNDQGYAAGR
ncbi:gamma-glutamyltransferase family protein [Sciscionella sediminilitoris]|uniref:gamma-glutamyltransferase family protein n=1 Tax=Sciscionella sediminilitoris TaxID=1445613 RepID=UPI0004DF49CD|nr:gamma-glutamyltransferase [Sciscionella sp. SE31]